MQLNGKNKFKLLLIMGLIIHVSFISLLWGIQRSNIYRDSRMFFEQDVNDENSVLLSNLESYNHVLYGLRGFVMASERVKKDEWALYTDSLSTKNTFPGLKGLAYFPYVTKDTKETFLAQLREDYHHAEDGIEPNLNWGDQDFYMPLQFVSVDGQMNRFIGTDYMEDEVRAKALIQTIESGVSVATEPFSPQMAKVTGVDYTIFLPIYKKYMPIDTLEQRKANILGVVGLALDLDELIYKSYLRFDNEYNVYLKVEDVTNPSNIIFIVEQGNPGVVDGDDNLLNYNILLGGRNLQFNFAAERYYRTNLVMVRNTDVFFGIVLVTGFIALLLTYRVVSMRKLKIEYDL